MNQARTLVLCIGTLLSLRAFGYGETTHEALSIRATERSWIAQRVHVLTDIGLETFARNQAFPLEGRGKLTVRELTALGSVLEDSRSFRQPLRHFFEATTGSGLVIGLPVQTIPSPSWATESSVSFDGTDPPQEFSFRDGRRYLFEALTQPAKATREARFGQVFLILGLDSM